jgi:hypothetical protein
VLDALQSGNRWDRCAGSIRGRVAGALMNAKADWFEGSERAAVERRQAGYDVSDHAASAAGHAAIVPDSLIDCYAIAGERNDFRAQLRRLMDTPGVDRGDHAKLWGLILWPGLQD